MTELIAMGFSAGAILGFVMIKTKIGCYSLVSIPVAMICYISWWQEQNPDSLRSTSGLDFLFGPTVRRGAIWLRLRVAFQGLDDGPETISASLT